MTQLRLQCRRQMNRIGHTGLNGRETVRAVAVLHAAVVQIFIQDGPVRHVAVRGRHEGVIERHPPPLVRVICALCQKLVVGLRQIRINL